MKPRSFKLNNKTWFISYDETMTAANRCFGNAEYEGLCLSELQRIVLNPEITEKALTLALDHETVHAILFEMDHPLAVDETFVSQFSELLNERNRTLK